MSETQHTPLTAEELEALRNTLIAQSSAPTVSIGPKAESEIQTLREQRDALLAACEDVAADIEAYCDDHNSDSPTDVTVVFPALLAAIAKAKPKGGG